jgi:hypothetical protein
VVQVRSGKSDIDIAVNLEHVEDRQQKFAVVAIDAGKESGKQRSKSCRKSIESPPQRIPVVMGCIAVDEVFAHQCGPQKDSLGSTGDLVDHVEVRALVSLEFASHELLDVLVVQILESDRRVKA